MKQNDIFGYIVKSDSGYETSKTLLQMLTDVITRRGNILFSRCAQKNK